ncbi:MAG: oligosaccharide repeat unit polymerase [Anaerolineae bacterium]|nr:oligosaccharide repeat unit polymerase [Anaerolineae bacterium]
MVIKKQTLLGIVFFVGIFLCYMVYLLGVGYTYLIVPSLLTFLLTILLYLPFFRVNFDIAEPYSFFALMYSGFVLSAGYSLSKNAFIRELNVSGELGASILNRTLVLLLLGLIAFQIAYLPGMQKLLRTARSMGYRVHPDDKGYQLKKTMLLLISVYLVVGFLGYYILYVRPMGGFFNLIRLFGVGGVAGEVGASSMFAPVLWWAILLWNRYHLEGSKNILFYPCLLFVLFTQFVRGRILGGVITPLLMLAIMWRYSAKGRYKNVSITSLALVILIVAILAFGVYGYRQASRLGEQEYAGEYIKTILSPEGLVEYILNSNNLPGVVVVSQILQGVPGDIPYQYGRTLLFFFEQAIPNQLAPQREVKPTVGAMVKNTWYGPNRGNQPPTFMGELYMNFSWPGVIVGMFIFGYFCVYMYKKLAYRREDWWIIIYAVFMTRFVMLAVKGEFGDHMADALIYDVLPIVLSVKLAEIIARFSVVLKTRSLYACKNSGLADHDSLWCYRI